MFSGLIAEKGRLARRSEVGSAALRLTVEHSALLAARRSLGSSLAVSGVCLTAIDPERDRTTFELSPETLRRTRLGALEPGAEVNLEPSLRAGDELGGHWVQGHVDGITLALERRDLGEHAEIAFALPAEWRGLVVEKGSIALDGVSLTIATLQPDRFSVALIPHTLAITTLGQVRAGDSVHVELDVLGKYVARLLALRGLA
jgi:riboflavin synthase